MNNNFINKAGFMLKKNSPTILMGLGIVGAIGSTVLACKATIKAQDIIEEKNKCLENIHTCSEDETIEYSEEDKKKDLTLVYTQTGIKILKVYAPSIILGILSISSIVCGNNILKKRNLSLAAAYTAVDKGFKMYRNNVKERFGEEVDKELRHGIKAKEIETTVVGKNSKEKTVKETVYEIDDLNNHSEYARFFDCGSEEHKKDPEYNLMFLRRQQDYANDLLKHKGYVFLNEVYDLLDIPKSVAGQSVGWIYDPDNNEGDNYIDFGIYNPTEANRRFVNGYEYNILLDFNVDGPILERLSKKGALRRM